MKSFMPWFCLFAMTASQAAQVMDGLEAYRQGEYTLAAPELLKQSAQNPLANYYLGLMRLYGYGELKNNILALRYLNNAAEKGILPAQQLLSRYFLAENNPEKSFYWFSKAALAGDVQAQMYCAAAYLFGFGVKKNPDLARRYYIDAAKNGNALAQYTLALHFLESRDLKSKKLGMIWLTKAADQGFAKAQFKLAELYEAGPILGRDSNKAKDLLEKAAAQQDVSAMLAMGNLAVKQDNFEAAKAWFTQADIQKDPRAQIALSQLYMNPQGPFYQPKTGFLFMLRAALSGSSDAQQALAGFYQEGKGVAADPYLAEQWRQKAKESVTQPSSASAMMEAVRWLTNDKASSFATTDYHLGGIFTAWYNPYALKENNYNQAPQMDVVTRSQLYKPAFILINPTEIPIGDYFDLLASTFNTTQAWAFPRYPLDAGIEALEHDKSLVLRRQSIGESTEDLASLSFKYLDKMKLQTSSQAKYQVLLTKLYNQAILGDSAAQFELGQLYHYGIAVAKNPAQAMTYYQLAAAQLDLRAEYNLGLLYLEGQITPVDYQKGIEWLTDAAFKGNPYAQYALANIYMQGLRDANGAIIVEPNQQQAIAMYYLASANHYGPAEYQLAEYLATQPKMEFSVAAKATRMNLIKRLYQDAVKKGIAEARLPLAFYKAMESNPRKQVEAYAVAQQEAAAGSSNAALLLGLLFERGISVPANLTQALSWYQKAAMNPINAFILGTYYSKGLGLNRDVEKGKVLLQQAADAGFSYAYLNLAILKQQAGEPFLADLDKARTLGNSIAGLLLADYYLAQATDAQQIQQAQEIYQYFAEKGDKDAQLKLAYLYDTGLNGQRDNALAAKWYTLAAEQGQATAQYLLGQLYQLGRIGKEADYLAAQRWYKLAAQQGYAPASVALGFLADTVNDDYQKASEYYQIAAQKENRVGLFNLALMNENGKGRPVQDEEARIFYLNAAVKGYPKAMTQLAGLYFKGLGGAREEQQALRWYQKAAGLGERDALYQLGLFSETGVMIKLDLPQAMQYYQRAAEKGHEKAKLALARMYQYGLGTTKDLQQAIRLYQELAENKNAFAQYQLAILDFDGSLGTHNVERAKQWLQSASENGSIQAYRMLRWLDAQQQVRISFIEPIVLNRAVVSSEQSADRMYFEAVSEWNRGNEMSSRQILDHLRSQFPQYAPAKWAYEQMNQLSNWV